MENYIKDKSINSNLNNVKDLDSMGKVVWEFLFMVYDVHWDGLYVDNSKMLFRNKVKSKFNPQAPRTLVNNKGKETVKPTYISSLSPPIMVKTPKEVNEISKYFKKNDNPQKKSYAQASFNPQSSNATMNTLKIKEMFPKLQNWKIDQIQEIINEGESKPKPHINMTTKSLSCKQIIIPMNKETANKYIKDVSNYISSINWALKVIKSKIVTNFIYIDDRGIIISTNNITLLSDPQKVEKIVKNLLQDNDDQIASPYLPQSKSYLKIVGISYVNKQINTHISPKDIKKILKSNHIFNDMVLTSRPRVIKVSFKSDMAII